MGSRLAQGDILRRICTVECSGICRDTSDNTVTVGEGNCVSAYRFSIIRHNVCWNDRCIGVPLHLPSKSRCDMVVLQQQPRSNTAPLSDTLSPTPWHPQGNGLTPLEIKAKKPPCSTPWLFKLLINSWFVETKIWIKDINGWWIFPSYHNYVIKKLRINIERVTGRGSSSFVSIYMMRHHLEGRTSNQQHLWRRDLSSTLSW